MFWKKKKKPGKQGKPQDIREAALAEARAARERIGEENLQQMVAAIKKGQQSVADRAKDKIRAADSDRVLDEFKYLLNDKDGKS
jgi:hypothetical protein